jgi:hypothetical protein
LKSCFKKIEVRVDGIVTDIAIHSYQIERHEEFTTSRLAQAISDDLQKFPIEVPGLKLEVHAEEFEPIQERRTGADLYISLVRRDYDIPVSKGVLVQAKRRVSLLKSDESRRLGNQSKRMYRRSHSSYVWIYEPDGITCAKAPRSSRPTLTRIANPMSVGELIADGLRCNLGGKEIGRDPHASPVDGISAVMRRLSVRGGLDFEVKSS